MAPHSLERAPPEPARGGRARGGRTPPAQTKGPSRPAPPPPPGTPPAPAPPPVAPAEPCAGEAARRAASGPLQGLSRGRASPGDGPRARVGGPRARDGPRAGEKPRARDGPRARGGVRRLGGALLRRAARAPLPAAGPHAGGARAPAEPLPREGRAQAPVGGQGEAALALLLEDALPRGLLLALPLLLPAAHRAGHQRRRGGRGRLAAAARDVRVGDGDVRHGDGDVRHGDGDVRHGGRAAAVAAAAAAAVAAGFVAVGYVAVGFVERLASGGGP